VALSDHRKVTEKSLDTLVGVGSTPTMNFRA
jgi:hypothetical protein